MSDIFLNFPIHLYSGGHHSTKPRLKWLVSGGQVQTKYILHISFFVESSNKLPEVSLILMNVSFKVGSQVGVPALHISGI